MPADNLHTSIEARPSAGAAPAAHSPASESTLLAVDRTRLAHERTLMAWVRTATSMISFGFSIYKFFETQPPREPRMALMARLLTARNFATLMISVALIALLFAAIQHSQELKALEAKYGDQPRSNSLMVAWLVGGFGVFAFLATIAGP